MAGMALMTAGGGSGGATILLGYQFIFAFNSGARATAAYRLGSDGIVYQSLNGGAYTSLATWCNPGAQAGNYECFATLSSGTLSSGTTGSWLALSSNQTWTRFADVGFDFSAELSIVIRRVGDTAIAASATIDLQATAI
jgi:hypothetical protein